MYPKNFNYANICGKLEEGFTYSHEAFGRSFFLTRVAVKRASGAIDHIPIMVPDEIIGSDKGVGSFVSIKGSLRSKVLPSCEGKTHLYVYIFVKEMFIALDETYLNDISILAEIRKILPVRETPFGRIITDFSVFSHSSGYRKYIIPCIAWGENACFMQHLKYEDRIVLWGRLQSREYEKNGEIRETYEFSVSKIW